jgi:hypothetical protein
MTRSFILLVFSLFLGVTALVAGCGGEAPVDESAAALIAVPTDDAGEPVGADSKRPPVVCGGVVCGRNAVCCHNHCFVPRQDRHCVRTGDEGADE